MKKLILNASGQPINLTTMESKLALNLEKRIKNDLGFKIDVTTLTTIMKKVSEQKFFEIAPADYLPVRVGEGSWSAELTTFRSFSLGDDFATGIMNTGSNNTRMASADAGVDSLTIPVNNWAKSIGWTLFELQQASKAGNWDIVSAKEKARKKNWDLGIQKIAFLGEGSVKGLLNQAGVNINTAIITKAIKSMTATELSTFAGAILDAYRVNCKRTAFPTHFVIPESDYLGLATPSSADFPLKSKLELLQETFRIMTRNANFQILPLAYGDSAYNALGKQRYALYNYEEESLRMDIPVDYTNTLANSNDNFNFSNVGYGQFTGALAYRPLEMLYFEYTP